MKINYPTKYAAMPIIEHVGGSDDVVCYIVSKCHLISGLTKYTEDGRAIKEYEVVFPYQPAEFNIWKRIIPTYNIINGYCINSTKVDAVFNSYEEALNYATNKNEELCENTWKYLSPKNIIEKIEEKKNNFAAKLAEYKILEQHISFHTDDIKIEENKKLNNAIEITNKGVKILPCSIYEVLQLFDTKKFVVYNIRQEQYNILKQLKGSDDIKGVIGHKQGLLIHKTKDDFIKLAGEKNHGAYIKNNCIYYDYEMEKVTKADFEKIDEDTLVFYTTETIEDIINSYEKHSEIDLSEIQEKVLKKTKDII